jgi:hypothetical protein
MRFSPPLRRARLMVGLAGSIVPLAWAGSALAATPTPPPAVVPASASVLLSAINSARTSARMAPMSSAGDLTSVATKQAAVMAVQGLLFHNPSLTTQITNWQSLGENVGSGLTPSGIATAFMGSTEHRDNILSTQFSQVGVGAVLYKGLIWVTEDFRLPTAAGARVTASNPAPAPTPAPKPAPAPAPAPTPAPAPVVAKPALATSSVMAVTPAAAQPSSPAAGSVALTGAATASVAPVSSAFPIVAANSWTDDSSATDSAAGPSDSSDRGLVASAGASPLTDQGAPMATDSSLHRASSWLSSNQSSSPGLPLAATALLLVVILMALGKARRMLSVGAMAAG